MAQFRMEVEVVTDVIFETSWVYLLRVRFLGDMQFFLGTPWGVVKTGWF